MLKVLETGVCSMITRDLKLFFMRKSVLLKFASGFGSLFTGLISLADSNILQTRSIVVT